LKKNDFGSEGGGQECISYRGPKFDMGFWVWFPWGKARPGRDADHSHPSSAEVKNE
jgi:hypothetical protein